MTCAVWDTDLELSSCVSVGVRIFQPQSGSETADWKQLETVYEARWITRLIQKDVGYKAQLTRRSITDLNVCERACWLTAKPQKSAVSSVRHSAEEITISWGLQLIVPKSDRDTVISESLWRWNGEMKVVYYCVKCVSLRRACSVVCDGFRPSLLKSFKACNYRLFTHSLLSDAWVK